MKVYNAYNARHGHTGEPTVILAKTIKGYGLGEAGEGRNVTHQQKKLNENELVHFRAPLRHPASPRKPCTPSSFYRPPEDSPEIAVSARPAAKQLGGYMPARKVQPVRLESPPLDSSRIRLQGSHGREVSTTMAFVAILRAAAEAQGDRANAWCPSFPTRRVRSAWKALFRQIGIYASQGQLYKPVDSENFLYYKESRDGQILEEGITEAGSMASFTAAGTSYANYGVPMIPFYLYYSMFGFQRVGDLIWAFADSRGRAS